MSGPVVALLLASLPGSFQNTTSLMWFKATASMEPSIASGQLLGVDKGAYRAVLDVRRGDIIAFRYPEAPENLFVHRVIGLPGEKVALSKGRVLINSVPLIVSGAREARTEVAGHAKYRILGAGACDVVADEMPTVQVQEDSFFVLGDNRCKSRDSRFWGQLTFALIVGKVVEVR